MHDSDGEENAEPVGALLRRHRLAAAQDAQSLARDLCISTRYLLAIETGQIQELPGVTYTLGFVRAYAEYFGLDEQKIVARFKQQHYPTERPTSLHFPSPEADAEIPKGAMLLATAFTACVLYAAWHLNALPGKNEINLVDPVPERLKTLLSTKALPEVPQSADGAVSLRTNLGDKDHVPQSSHDVSAGQGTAPLDVETTETAETAKTPLPETPDETQASDLTQHQTAEPDESHEDLVRADASTGTDAPERRGHTKAAADGSGDSGAVLLRASSECWIEIRDQAGELVYAKLLEPGETYRVPKNAPLTLRAGNAGGLEVYIDGRQLPPLGRSGAILSHISLDAETLRARTRGG